MASLLSDFGSKPKPVERKPAPIVHKPKPATHSRLAMQHKDQNIYIKQESAMESEPDLGTDENMDNFGEDIDMSDDTMLVENQLKKEVEDLSIGERSKPNFTTTKAADTRHDLQNWKTAEAIMVDTFAQDVIKEETSKMEILESDGSLHMWWYDAYERREKGYVYLFGKVLNKNTNKYVSCCVTVKNIERNLFILPRPYELDGKEKKKGMGNVSIIKFYIENGIETENDVTIASVYEEIAALCSSKRITNWMSKEVTRKYAFELPNVPAESNYLKVVYDYERMFTILFYLLNAYSC